MDFVIVLMLFLMFIGLLGSLVYASFKRHNAGTSKDRPLRGQVQSEPDHSSFTEEELAYLKKVAEYCGVDRVTRADLRKYSTHIISELFLSMPGWSIWDPSIHEADGQYSRMERSQLNEISIMEYDPIYKIAKVDGTTGNYLTSYRRCSCLDYRKRRLPCKHMYALACELDGDATKKIVHNANRPLEGLEISFGGFRSRKDDPDGIRAKINRRGAIWTDTISNDTAALVLGEFATRGKKDFAERMDLEVFDEKALMEIFT